MGLAALGAAVVAVAASGAVIPQGRVRPNLQFGALINGRGSTATVSMGCFGAVRPGERGHPMNGQTLEVFRPEALRVQGYTGANATSIVARFSDDPSVTVSFNRFGVTKALPTTLSLPCSGSGQVTFTPEPLSPSARAASVTVGYASQP
ncbi:MAG: hypothetical protein JO176_11505 [Acidimicrobiia bacterium]|nr:hypothetical protein [Acidimicrobiia bacterium]